MEIDCKELKRLARERMGMTVPKFWLVTLIYFLMTTGLSCVADFIPLAASDSPLGITTTALFLGILLTLYTTVVDFGYTLWTLWAFRRLEPGMYSLLQGFSVAGRVILLQLGILVRMIGWIFLLSFALSALLLFSMPLLMTGFPLLMILLTSVLYAAMWAIQLRYALAPYLLADRPDDGAAMAINRSVILMRGWKWELFKLEFSFIGWHLLELVLSGGVLLAFLIPSGLFSALMSMDMTALQELVNTAAANPVQTLLSSLASLPVLLWLLPYRGVSVAGFYDARQRLYLATEQEQTPLDPIS